ncbi:MAG TPA: cupin domain-containing protein [Trueperaceae bacterium]|nr:cupin domain-containing protein [Trueperaceae bacterium]
MSSPIIVRPGQGKVLDLGNFEAVILASAADTSNAFTLLQTQKEPPDFGPPMHIHHDAAEAFFVLEGNYLMYLEDRQDECPPGTFVYVPRGTPHTFKVVSPGPGKKLNLFAPAAMQGFFEELAASEAAGIVSPEDLEAISGRHHMEVVGPVPDTYL